MSLSSKTEARKQFEQSILELALSINRQTNIYQIKNKILKIYITINDDVIEWKPELMGNSHQEINMKLYSIKMLKEQIKDIENSLPEGVLE